MEDENTNLGSFTFPAQVSSLRKGGHVVVRGFPCKITEMKTSKPGKHGSSKVALVAVDIFTGKKYEEISPSSQNMDVPNVSKAEYQLVDISDDRFCSLMSLDGSTKDDLRLPTDLATEIESAFRDDKDVTVTVLKSMGLEQIISYKL